MMRALLEAARLAREASTVTTQRRVVELVVTELGLIVRGRYADARYAFGHSHEVPWQELEVSPHLASNAVRLVVRTLEDKGDDHNIVPVRTGE